MRKGLLWPILLVACTKSTTTPLGPKDSGTTGNDASDDAGTSDDTGVIAQDTGVVTPDTGVPYYTWWQDVEPIVSVRCQLCHANPPQFGAPRSFVEYEDTQVLINNTPAHQVMVFRIMADMNRMPPSTQPQLTDEE